MDKILQHSYAAAVYHSSRWVKVRALAIKKSDGLCARCLKEGLYTPATTVHHIIELTPENVNDPSICFNLDNLEALCDEHHLKAHGKLQHRYKIDPVTGAVLFDGIPHT